MKKNGHKSLTWAEMLKVEDKHPFSAGNLQSLRMGSLSPSRVMRLKRKHSKTAKSYSMTCRG